jgi:P27 family predicted phage terminase small subunit
LPDAIKIARGTLRSRDGDPDAKPHPPAASIGEPPAQLRETGIEKWRTVGPLLVSSGLLTEIDMTPFVRYCHAHDEVERLNLVIEEQGEYFTAESGYVGQHPAVNQKFKWLAEINRFEARFGMNASDRCGIEVAKPKAGGVARRKRA